MLSFLTDWIALSCMEASQHSQDCEKLATVAPPLAAGSERLLASRRRPYHEVVGGMSCKKAVITGASRAGRQVIWR